MAIAWLYRRQYERAGMQMLAVVDSPAGAAWCAQAVLGAAALLPTSLVFGLYQPGLGGLLQVTLALFLGVALLVSAVRFFHRRDEASARTRLLRASLIYLPALLALLMLIPLV